MNYNTSHRVNYQSPSNGGYANSNGTPQYNPQTEQQNVYSSQTTQRQSDAGQYGAYPPFSNNQYLPSPSLVAQNHPVVVIPQRSPAQSNYFSSQLHHPSTPIHQTPDHLQRQPIPHWQQSQQPLPPPVQYQSSYPPQFPAMSPNVYPQPLKAIVEIPVLQQRVPQRQVSGNSSHVQDVKKEHTRPEELPVDYQLLLLSLAEEYIDAAHGLGPMVALYRRSEDMDQYNQLIAMGLSCIEAVLKKFRLQPRQEAWLTLQYASLMFEETEISSHMEAILSKGITLCDRHKLLDLKYSMQHLFARVLFKTKPRAAFKSLDTLIPNAEAYKHVPWIYALRFLRVALSLQVAESKHELSAALHHLRAVSALSEAQGDYAVFVTSATLEATIHLRAAGPDSLEQAQCAIASARALQLQPSVSDLVQVWTLLNLLDVSCSLVECKSEQAGSKIALARELNDSQTEQSVWNHDGTFAVPLQGPVSALTASTNGIFRRDKSGKDCIVLAWLNKRDLDILTFLLSGTVSQLKNTLSPKTDEFLAEGLKMVEDNFDGKYLTGKPLIAPTSSSLSAATHRLQGWTQLQWHLHLFLAFQYSTNNNWAAARTHLKALSEACPDSDSENSARRKRWTTYLTGIIEQGTGNTAAALAAFQDPVLAISKINANRTPDPLSDLCLLAALNILLIVRSPTHPENHLVERIAVQLQPLTLNHVNKSIVSSMYLLKSVLSPTDTITSRKQSLQSALNFARSVNNQQLLAMSMSVMTSMFFKDIVGEQAKKSTQAAVHLAKRARSSLWGSVAQGMSADTSDRLGDGRDAEAARTEAERHVALLPKAVQDSLLVG